METRSRFESTLRSLAILCTAICTVGAAAAVYVVLIRVPALAMTKLDLLFGTLLGVAVGLLFAIAALLVNLTSMVRRGNFRQALSSAHDKSVNTN